MTEHMDIVDDNDNVVGRTTQGDIYARKLTHRIVHVFVLHPDTNEVYFQQRSMKKSFLPGYYCTSAGGHVMAGERYEDAARRELAEELGLSSDLHEVTSLQYEDKGHKRHIRLYVTFTDDDITFADGEVADGGFMDLDAAHSLVVANEKIHPQLALCYAWFYKHKEQVFKSCLRNN